MIQLIEMWLWTGIRIRTLLLLSLLRYHWRHNLMVADAHYLSVIYDPDPHKCYLCSDYPRIAPKIDYTLTMDLVQSFDET